MHYHSIKDGKIYLLPTLGQPEREIGEVKISEEETIAYFTARFDTLVQKIDTLKEKIDNAENKGSFMMKLQHMKETLKTYNGIGDFEALLKKLEDTEQLLQVGIEQNRVKNESIKKGLIQQLEVFINSDNWTEDVDKVKEIQTHWNKTGKAAEQEEEKLQTEFKEKKIAFFNKSIDGLNDMQKELVSVRKQQYQFLVDEAKKLSQGNLKENVTNFKELQDKWKEIKEIPSNLYEPLINEFKKTGNSFFTKLKSNKRSQHQKGNSFNGDPHAEWEKILTQADALYTNTTTDAVKLAKTLQQQLKELKIASRKKGFRGEGKLRAACEYVFEKQYLERRVRERNSDFNQLDAASQTKEMIQSLRYMIKRDEEEIKQMEQNKEKMVFNNSNQDFSRIFDSRLSSHTRKLKAKLKIMEELSEQK